jgi:hypothetical protein
MPAMCTDRGCDVDKEQVVVRDAPLGFREAHGQSGRSRLRAWQRLSRARPLLNLQVARVTPAPAARLRLTGLRNDGPPSPHTDSHYKCANTRTPPSTCFAGTATTSSPMR